MSASKRRRLARQLLVTLPNELIRSVVEFLDLLDEHRLRRACRGLVSSIRPIQRTHFVSNCILLTEAWIHLFPYRNYLQKIWIVLGHVENVWCLAERILQCCPHLKTLYLQKPLCSGFYNFLPRKGYLRYDTCQNHDFLPYRFLGAPKAVMQRVEVQGLRLTSCSYVLHNLVSKYTSARPIGLRFSKCRIDDVWRTVLDSTLHPSSLDYLEVSNCSLEDTHARELIQRWSLVRCKARVLNLSYNPRLTPSVGEFLITRLSPGLKVLYVPETMISPRLCTLGESFGVVVIKHF